MKYPIIPKIAVFLSLLALSACHTFNYKTYDEKQNKDIDDPEPNYELTLDPGFQNFTSFMFIGNRIENFSTYFNTYFNANENFSDAYDDYATRVLASYNEKQDSIFAKPQLSQEAIDKFTVAIEKASKVIQYHKSSQYMDRAVLLIGKSYFYLGDYLKAERKFGEFISKLKSSIYLDEALLYLARTQLRLDNEKPALERLNELIKSSKEKNVVSESYQSLAEYYLNKKDYESAVKNFRKAIELSGDSEFKAQMQFLVASVNAKTNTKQAAKEFDKVLDYNASYDLEYLARLNTAKYMIQSGNFKGANDIIEDLEVKYKDVPENLSNVNYLHAVYFDEKKDLKNSQEHYYDVIKGFPSTIPSADASFKLGKYFEQKNDYLRALMYYRYSTEQSQKGTFYQDAVKKAAVFKRYFELRSIISGEQINTDYNEEFRKKTTKDFDKNNDPNNPNKGFDNGKSGGYWGVYDKRYSFADSIIAGDDSTFTIADTSREQARKISAAKFEIAELFLYDLNKADSSEIYLKQAFDESLDYEFSAKVLFALSALYRKLDDIVKSEEILNRIVKEFPLAEVANSSRKLLNISMIDAYTGDSSDSIYSAAENRFIEKDYTGALSDFRVLITDYPSSVHLEKAFYGAGWIYENVLYNNDSAYYYYNYLVNNMAGSEAAANVSLKVEEYNLFNNVNKQDTSGTLNTPENSNPLNGNNELKDPVNNNQDQKDPGNIDPMQLLKEVEENEKKNKGEQQDGNNPEKNTEEAPDQIKPPDGNK